MKKIVSTAIIILFTCNATVVYSQIIRLRDTVLQTVNVSVSAERWKGKEFVRVIKDSAIKEFDEPTFVKITGTDFINGTIEVKVLSRLLKNAPDFVSGFIGVAFRINDSNSKFECIYLRPTNGRADNQLRRNRSIQYFSYPDYQFERLRKDAPGEYETYADIGLDEWITMRIEVKDKQARLFLNNNKKPSLIVNDLKKVMILQAQSAYG